MGLHLKLKNMIIDSYTNSVLYAIITDVIIALILCIIYKLKVRSYSKMLQNNYREKYYDYTGNYGYEYHEDPYFEESKIRPDPHHRSRTEHRSRPGGGRTPKSKRGRDSRFDSHRDTRFDSHRDSRGFDHYQDSRNFDNNLGNQKYYYEYQYEDEFQQY